MAWAYLASCWLCAGVLFGCGDNKFGSVDASTDSSLACTPMAIEACYTGPANTQGIGACVAGTRTCAADGSGFGPCTGEVVPTAETCATVGDDDCDGMANEDGEGCTCAPGSTMPCYTGPAKTENLGVCAPGVATCNEQGTGYGACDGEVLPTAETCTTLVDDDCDGLVNEEGEGCACAPSSIADCYTGPAGTENVGACHGGSAACNAEGTAYGACTGEVTPTAETCNTPIDDDCDGQINEEGEGCECIPNSVAACYTGTAGTENVGVCVGGTKTCNAQGTAYGPCTGEVIPSPETCNTDGDDDCDGLVNEEGDGCTCVPGSTASCYTGPEGTANVGVCAPGVATCNAQGTGYGACVGEVTPGVETCNTPVDDDCDGLLNEEGAGCACLPNSVTACYTGPAGTEGEGVCAAGFATCNAQGTAYGPCTGEVTPTAETCNTPVDDDCDGQLNEEGAGCACLPSSITTCYSGPAGTENVGLCASGTATCNALGTAYGACVGDVTPASETCLTPGDDDCDGQVNESGAGCACLPSSSAACYTGPVGTENVGVCAGGTKTCNAQGTAYGACAGEVTPGVETCNTPDDDDCDGQVNEEGAGCACIPSSSAACYTGPAGTENVGVCAGGTKTCNAQGTAYGPCTGEVTPGVETCNTNGDDDCDGLINESGAGCVCTPNALQSCYSGPAATVGVGACSAGTRTCNAQGTAFGSCTGETLPSAESCLTPGDDDCDGQANEGCVCVPNSTTACYSGPAGTQGVGTCTSGTATCNAQGTAYGPCIGEVLPNTESCLTPGDDNCNGEMNEGCACVPNSTTACYSGPAGTQGVGVCTGGTATCNAQGTAYGPCVGEVLPNTETCNTPSDDDCDGQINESGAGCVCAPNAMQSCYSGPAGTMGVGACKAGTRTCNAQGTAYGTCAGEVLPATESCATPADDDCDGQANEGCAALSCSLYSENFDDGNAGEITTGTYKTAWCDTYIPLASNSPLCMLGRTLRTNDSTIDPTMWIHKTQASCTSAKLTYSYYQFASAGVTVTYQQSNDAAAVCEKPGTFTTAAVHTTLQTCLSQTVTIPFGTSSGVYVRFEHGAGTNAIWLDNVTVELLGCDC